MAPRSRSRAWVLRQVDRLPLATVAHLELAAAGDSAAPSRSSIYSTCRSLSADSSSAAPLLAQVDEPGGEIGYVLTRAGRAEVVGQSARVRPPNGVDEDLWWREWAVSLRDEVRAHTRLTTDLAVVLDKYGEVVTEFEEGGRRPQQRFQPDWEEPESLTRRPDLMLIVGGDSWAIEIERTEKGSDGRGGVRYRDLAVKAAEGRFLLGGPMTAVSGVWYLANERSDLGGSASSRVADRVVRGVFNAADVTEGDLFCLVDPLSHDELSESTFRVRRRRLEVIVEQVLPVLVGRTADTGGGLTRGYVVPSRAELPPRRIRSRSVVAVGELVTCDQVRGHGVLRVASREVQLRSIPGGLSVPVTAGDRIAVFGRLIDRAVIDVSNLRAVGVDWEPTSQARSAETVRQRRRAEEEARWDTDDGWF